MVSTRARRPTRVFMADAATRAMRSVSAAFRRRASRSAKLSAAYNTCAQRTAVFERVIRERAHVNPYIADGLHRRARSWPSFERCGKSKQRA